MNRFTEGVFAGALIVSAFWAAIVIAMAASAGWIE